MSIPTALQQQLHDRVKQCYAIASERLNHQFEPPIVLFNQRGKIAGSALLQKNTLRFHPLIYQQNQTHFLTHVVAHEIAHLIVWQLFGKVSPHGQQWQMIMRQVFELPASRTHQYNVENIGIKHFTYQCDCAEISLSIRRHNKVIKGAQYICKRCKQAISIKN